MKNAIEITGLTKSYGENQVLKGLDLEVKQGEIFALLGTNGAGKTTTLECMEGLRRYDGGKIRVEGRLGVQLQSTSLPKTMKAREALGLFGRWQEARVSPQTLENLGVAPLLDKQYGSMSTGQQRRLHLAVALLGDPDILVLDEPTAGLDVEGRVGIHKEIRALRDRGKTILLATHDMAEVAELADRTAVLREGRIVFLGTPAQMEKGGTDERMLKAAFSGAFAPDGLTGSEENGIWRFRCQDLEQTLSQILRCCRDQNVRLEDVEVERLGLERRFLEIAKEGEK